MNLHRRLLALGLACWVAFAQAAPETVTSTDRPAAESPASTDGESVASATDDAVGDMLLQAISLMGVAYRWGGSNPATGLDCSGFVQYVFKKSLKMNLPRTAAEQARVGRKIDRSGLMPGDLVFFNTLGSKYSHVGIYLGNSKFIQSPRTGKRIQVSSMKDNYWASRFTEARRVTGQERQTVTEDAGSSSDTETRAAPAAGAARSRPAGKRLAATICPAGAKGRRCRREAARQPKASTRHVRHKARKGHKRGD